MKALHRLRIRMLRDPIQRLRLRLITVAMASVAVALVLIFAVVNLLNYRSLTERSDYLIETIYRHDGEFPDHLPPDGNFEFSQETPLETRYFMVTVTSAGSIESVDADHIASGGRESAEQTAQDILARGRESGYWGQYRYRVYSDDDGSKTVVIVDCFVQLQSICNLAVISAAVAGDVSLMLTRARRDAELTVRNPCVGLDASETDRLFERFYRPDPSRERGTGGYGIGLSIARSVTERHGGKIRAKKVGDDLEIVVTLPLAR